MMGVKHAHFQNNRKRKKTNQTNKKREKVKNLKKGKKEPCGFSFAVLLIQEKLSS